MWNDSHRAAIEIHILCLAKAGQTPEKGKCAFQEPAFQPKGEHLGLGGS